MSSMYRLLCLTHDPAIVLDEEWHSGGGGCERAIAAIAEPPAAHALCDLVVGRYSYPLVEVACPGYRDGAWHRDPEWIDADWLRLLLAAQKVPDLADLCARAARCWPEPRLRRLREELRT